jgi:hypothetical protein
MQGWRVLRSEAAFVAAAATRGEAERRRWAVVGGLLQKQGADRRILVNASDALAEQVRNGEHRDLAAGRVARRDGVGDDDLLGAGW